MREVSKELGAFQVSLSNGHTALIPPKIATEVFSSIAYLEDMTATALARKTGTQPKSMINYCNVDSSHTPNFNKTVSMLKTLGYDLYLKKSDD